MPTDTIFGLVGSALDKGVVERIYEIKGRPGHKPFIILISQLDQLELFGINISEVQKESLASVWPAPVSVIIPCPNDEIEYLHRGRRSLAFRLPEPEWLRDLVIKTGPIIATSANLAGEPAVDTIEKAKINLPGLDFYIDGEVGNEPSKLMKLESNGQLNPVVRG